MTLQNTFYVLGIVFMSLSILLLIAMVIATFYIKSKIAKIQEIIEEKLNLARHVANHPSDIAVDLGTVVASKAIKKAKSFLNKK